MSSRALLLTILFGVFLPSSCGERSRLSFRISPFFYSKSSHSISLSSNRNYRRDMHTVHSRFDLHAHLHLRTNPLGLTIDITTTVFAPESKNDLDGAVEACKLPVAVRRHTHTQLHVHWHGHVHIHIHILMRMHIHSLTQNHFVTINEY